MFGLFRRAAQKVRVSKTQVMRLGTPQWMKHDMSAYAEEGYSLNVIVFRCVDIISKGLASIPLQVMEREDELEKHPLVELLQQPNKIQGGADFLETLVAFRLITGNSYAEVIDANGVPKELWPWAPFNMRVVAQDGSFLPAGYIWSDGKVDAAWEYDEISGRCDLLHWKTFNPMNHHIGMSPIASAAYSVDQHNEAGRWNMSMLQNSAQPSGVLQTEETLTDAQFQQIRQRLEQQSGPGNAREKMILEGGLSWQQLSLSPRDMDWLDGRKVAAQDIAGAFGVPLQVVPLEGSQTFANYEQARASLYEDTIIPLLDNLLDELNRWLVPRYGNPNVRIQYDLDRIPALEPRRQARWVSMQNADWLTINEKREATGYDRVDVEGADEIYINSGMVPLSVDDEPEESPRVRRAVESDFQEEEMEEEEAEV